MEERKSCEKGYPLDTVPCHICECNRKHLITLKDEIEGLLYNNSTGESDEGKWIECSDYHHIAEIISNHINSHPTPEVKVPIKEIIIQEAFKKYKYRTVSKRIHRGEGFIDGANFVLDWIRENNK